jgi:cytochrome P450
MLMIASADRDLAQFKNPNVLDLLRRGPPHLAFGHGVHACIGAALIRTVSKSAMSVFLTHFQGAEIVEYKLAQGFAIRSLETLVV